MSYIQNRLKLFSNRSFSLYVASCALAMYGNGLTYIIMTWVLMRYQSSVSAVAILMSCFWLPNIVLGPIFGVYVDRLNRKHLLVIANGLRCVILLIFSLVLSRRLNALMIYGLAFITGTILSLYIPAAMSLVREIVPKSKLLYANATVDIAYELGAVIGMGTAGIVLALTSIETCFFINAACYGVATGFMLFIKHTSQIRTKRKTSILKDFMLGWRYVLHKIPLLLIYTVQMLFFVSYMTAPVLLAPFAKTILHTTVGQFGWIEAAMSLGAVVGGVLSPYFAEKYGFTKVMVVEALLAAMSFILFSHNFYIPMSVLLYFFIGFSFSAWPLLITYAQDMTSLRFQGRVQSLFNSISGVMILLFYLLLGKADHLFAITQLYWGEVLLMVFGSIILVLLYQSKLKGKS
jgi:MFS transporter, DHA3 family, macrolide efflux protein